MGMTSSFLDRDTGNRAYDTSCFSALYRIVNATIIIEKNKQFFKNYLFTYLDDLKEMGFNYVDYEIVEGNIHVNLDKNLIGKKRIAFCMAVRYLWEGKYRAIRRETTPYDDFYNIVVEYRKLANKLPEFNKLQKLCLAHNIYIFRKKRSFNSNHCWSMPISGVKMNKYLRMSQSRSVNQYFMNKTTKINCFERGEQVFRNKKMPTVDRIVQIFS